RARGDLPDPGSHRAGPAGRGAAAPAEGAVPLAAGGSAPARNDAARAPPRGKTAMSGLEEFHFLRPLWLIALVPCFILWWQALRRRLGPRSWENVCDPALVPYILAPGSVTRRRWVAHLPGIAAVLAILALA